MSSLSDATYAYPFDPTGTKATNKVSNEKQVITAPPWKDYNFIIPKFAPFFKDSMVIVDQASGDTLVEGQDYLLGNRFLGASRSCAKMIFGSIYFLDKTRSGVVDMTYQTIGGEWTLDEAKIMEILDNRDRNPLIITWEQIANTPNLFPPIDHQWHLKDMVGMSKVVDALKNISQTILNTRQNLEQLFQDHLSNKNNPHETTKIHVGLGDVENFGIATMADAQDGTSNEVYMTPLRTQQQIDANLMDIKNRLQTLENKVG